MSKYNWEVVKLTPEIKFEMLLDCIEEYFSSKLFIKYSLLDYICLNELFPVYKANHRCIDVYISDLSFFSNYLFTD